MDPVEQGWVCCWRRRCRHNCFRPAVRGGAGARCEVGRGRGTAAKAERTRIDRRRRGREEFSAVWRPQWHVQRPVAGLGRWCAVGIAAANLLTAGCNFRCRGGHVGMCGWARRLEDGRGAGGGSDRSQVTGPPPPPPVWSPADSLFSPSAAALGYSSRGGNGS